MPTFDIEHLTNQLIQWCHINSGSKNLEGLAQMHALLHAAFSPLADHAEILDFPPIEQYRLTGERILQPVGKGLWFQKRPELKRRVLLCGHMDTVYPPSSSFQTTMRLPAGRMQGPGVADMKGGLLIMLHALMAFEQTQTSNTLGWDVFINADEELGSLASSDELCRRSQSAQVGLVFEPALDVAGHLARARKGAGHFTLHAQGKAAHTGRDFEHGRNAILLLAHAIVAIDALNGQRPGLTLNVGLIQGGDVLNQVPNKAGAKIEIRYTDPNDKVWVLEQLQNICNNETGLSLKGHFHRPTKTIDTPTTHLFETTQAIGKTLGLHLDWKDSGGCCDGNNLAQQGLAVLDTLGARGGNIHTEDEFICLESIPERIQLTSRLLEQLGS